MGYATMLAGIVIVLSETFTVEASWTLVFVGFMVIVFGGMAVIQDEEARAQEASAQLEDDRRRSLYEVEQLARESSKRSERRRGSSQ